MTPLSTTQPLSPHTGADPAPSPASMPMHATRPLTAPMGVEDMRVLADQWSQKLSDELASLKDLDVSDHYAVYVDICEQLSSRLKTPWHV
ncbi:hypothetical protein [Actinomyces vulturis]|uniref:hypothetical protein n=1 Tax=Actinomyces vulturis TaxID=1857645 RepID=UPI0011464CB2|nr:hypothetical protein [Actinomyces vulturis]